MSDGKYDLYDANQLIGKTNHQPMNVSYITIIKDGAGVGRTRILPSNTMFIGTMGGLISKDSNLYFVNELLVKEDLSKKYSGSTIPHIYFKDYGSEIYSVPTLKEQTDIGNLFEIFDSLLTLHQREGSSYKVARDRMTRSTSLFSSSWMM